MLHACYVRVTKALLERGNMTRALKRVVENKGAPGVDGMNVHHLKGFCK